MKLHAREDGKFRIVQFTDTHIGAKPFNNEDLKTFELISQALNNIEADLIMLTGDNIWSHGVENTDLIQKEYLEHFNQVKTPIALTYGNHDSEAEFTRGEIRAYERYLDNPAPKTDSFIVDDRESFTVKIYEKDSDDLLYVLYVMDSGADARYPIGIYDWILPEQVEWFRRTSNKYKELKRPDTDLIFMHIPVPEYREASENILVGEHLETNDPISAPYLNTGLFTNAYINGKVSGFFSGHDHDNNFVGEYIGIKLVFGQVSGYNCYGELDRGVRIIELSPAGMETYTVTHEVFREQKISY